MESRPAPWIAALHDSHERLRHHVDRLDAAAIEGPSYASEWSVAKVLSHLGSGAEIFSLFLDAGLRQEQPPGSDVLKAIWGAWDDKQPQEQARDALAADGRLVERFAALDAKQLAAMRLDLLGMERDTAGLAALRLGEHALHTWDIIVMAQPDAGVAPGAAALLVDALEQTVERVAKADARPRHVVVSTVDPERHFVLETADTVTLRPAPATTAVPSSTRSTNASEGSQAQLRLPAEALVRLVYGRLDPQHTPPVEAQGVKMSELREIFPGF